MEHFREVQDGIFLLKSPFPPVWSGVTLVRGEELCLIDSGASADVVDGVIRPALAEHWAGAGRHRLARQHALPRRPHRRPRPDKGACAADQNRLHRAGCPGAERPCGERRAHPDKVPQVQSAAPVLPARCGAGSCPPGRGGAGRQTYGAAHPGT